MLFDRKCTVMDPTNCGPRTDHVVSNFVFRVHTLPHVWFSRSFQGIGLSKYLLSEDPGIFQGIF